ncbi:MAG: hypothetical protein ABI430_04310 [Candidatus Taylorbacteria bacterium]
MQKNNFTQEVHLKNKKSLPTKPLARENSRHLGLRVRIAIFVASFGLVLLVAWVKTTFTTSPQNATGVEDDEEYIIRKVSKDPLKSRFTPVLIYRVLGGETGTFAGSGSLFAGSHGIQVITAEHLFGKKLGDQIFAVRKLRPYETDATHGIESILNTGSQIADVGGQSPDIIVLKAGQAKTIRCFSEETLDLRTSPMELHRIDQTIILTSLVSDEKVRVLGTAMSLRDGKGVQYSVLEYASNSGESGTGFVDEDDNLFVLKGSATGDGNLVEKSIQKFFGTTRKMSIAYGSIKIR